MRRNLLLSLALASAVAAGTAAAQTPRAPGDGPGYGPGPGMGPGMTGPGMMGPGMMGPGYGPGMMGPGYGPGMMGPGPRGGYGPGPGYGAGAGMMGLRQLDLTDAQRAEVNKIMDDLRRKNWDLLGKTQDETARLRDIYAADRFDRAAASAAYKRLGELRLARIENTLEAHERIDAVLTPEQRKQLRRWSGNWAPE